MGAGEGGAQARPAEGLCLGGKDRRVQGAQWLRAAGSTPMRRVPPWLGSNPMA